MFSQFRVRYPTGSLISELITIDRGQYIVRAQVVVDGVVLSSGLAAAETVEGAEDRAKERALGGLELEVPSPLSANFSGTSNHQPSTSPYSVTRKPRNQTQGEGASVATPASTPAVVSPEYEDEDWVSYEEEPISRPTSSPDPSVKVPVLPPMPIQSSSSTQTSVGGYRDLSDEVAKMKVELSRLHWTPEQGKKHLIETYNKSSSKDLTDEEFFDFLRYLESLPTPMGKTVTNDE